MFTAAKIKLIYCYLVCLFLTIFLVIKAGSMTQDFLRLKNFDDSYQIAYNLTKSSFFIEKNKKLAPEKIEQLRLEAIEEDKIREYRRIKSNIMLDIPYVLYSLLALGIHIILIRKTKAS